MLKLLECLAYEMYRRTAINYRPRLNRCWYHIWKKLRMIRYKREVCDGNEVLGNDE